MRTKAPRNQGQYYYRDQLSLQGQWIYDALEAHCRRKDYRNQIQFRMKRFDTFMKDISRAYQALRDGDLGLTAKNVCPEIRADVRLMQF